MGLVQTDLPFTPTADGLRLNVRLVPRAARTEINRVVRDDAGAAYLKVKVGEPPEGGKANRALLALLAKKWKVPASSINLVSGASARRKTLRIKGDAGELSRKISSWIRENHD